MNEKQLETLRKNNEESRDFVKSCFRFALMVILKDKSNKTLSITRLCTIAGVSRMAFYRNYDSVDDVLTDQIASFVSTYLERMHSNVYENWVAFFALVEEQKDDLLAMLKAGFEAKILEVFLSKADAKGEEKINQLIWLSLSHSLMVYWLKEGRPETGEEMARLALKQTRGIPITFVS